MSLSHRLRLGVFERLPQYWRPVAEYHHLRLRGLLDRELAWLAGYARAGQRVIDVGANNGVYTHALARLGASVEAFEPQPGCLAPLQAYARKHANVRAHGVALGTAAGSATLRVPIIDGQIVSGRASLTAWSPATRDFDVEVRTMDSYEFDQVSAVKIDVEGHELDVLAGARRTLERWRPALLLELEQRHLARPLADAFREVQAMGYRGTFLSPDGAELPLTEFAVDRHQSPNNADRPRAPYVNNFLFVATGRHA